MAGMIAFLSYDANLLQWRHVPDEATFQVLEFYWCDVTAADVELLQPGPPSGYGAPSDDGAGAGRTTPVAGRRAVVELTSPPGPLSNIWRGGVGGAKVGILRPPMVPLMVAP